MKRECESWRGGVSQREKIIKKVIERESERVSHRME
mgnify:CR=1 FL=1